MKQVNLTITFDEEKLSALKRYMDVSAAAPSKSRRSPRAAAPKPDQEPEVIQ